MSPHAKPSALLTAGKRTFRSFAAGATEPQPLVLVEKLSAEGKLQCESCDTRDAQGKPCEEDEQSTPPARLSPSTASTCTFRTAEAATPEPLPLHRGSLLEDFLRERGGSGQLDPEDAVRIDIARIHKELEQRATCGKFEEETTVELTRRLGLFMRKYPQFFEDV